MIRKFSISLPEFVWVIDKAMPSFKKIYSEVMKLQSTLIISKSKGPSETLRDNRTPTYQIFRIEENTNQTTNFTNEYVNRLL